MKTFTLKQSMPVLAILGVLVGAHGSASALTTEHASICKPYGNSSTAGLYTYVNGAYNYSGGSIAVACPVVRASGTTNLSVWVDGTAASGTTYCALYSYNYTNAYLGSVSFSATGTFDRLLTLPLAQVPTFSSQVVYCSMPNGAGLWDIEPTE